MPKRSPSPRSRKQRGQTPNDIVRYRPGMKGQTDWQRVRNMTDEEIDAGIKADPDAPPEIDESWMADAEVVFPEKKTAIHIRLDNDIVDFFKQSGRGYQTKINAVLRGYVREKQRPPRRRATQKRRA